MPPTKKNNIVSVDSDLSDILSAEVVSNHSAPVFIAEQTEDSAELRPEEPQELIQEQVRTDQQAPGADYHQFNDEPQSLSPDDMATIGVNILDGLQRFGFAFLRKKAVFSDAEQEILGELNPSGNTAYATGSKEDIAFRKFKKHLEFVKTLPFRDDEKQRLTDATKIYLRTTQVTVSPFTGLLLAYSEVLGMRAITTFSEEL